MPLTPPSKKPLTAEEQKERRNRMIMWIVIGSLVGGIIIMIATNAPEKNLVCNRDVRASLNSFGTCTEE